MLTCVNKACPNQVTSVEVRRQAVLDFIRSAIPTIACDDPDGRLGSRIRTIADVVTNSANLQCGAIEMSVNVFRREVLRIAVLGHLGLAAGCGGGDANEPDVTAHPAVISSEQVDEKTTATPADAETLEASSDESAPSDHDSDARPAAATIESPTLRAELAAFFRSSAEAQGAQIAEEDVESGVASFIEMATEVDRDFLLVTAENEALLATGEYPVETARSHLESAKSAFEEADLRIPAAGLALMRSAEAEDASSTRIELAARTLDAFLLKVQQSDASSPQNEGQ